MGELGVLDPAETNKSNGIDFARLAFELKEGSKEAEETLYEFLVARWTYYLKNSLREDYYYLPDIISESFIKIVRNLKSGYLNNFDSFESYCTGVVLKTTKEFLAKKITERKRNLPSSTLEGYNLLEELLNSSANVGNENANDPETELLRRERLQTVETLINSLTDKQDRQILKMFYLEGKTKEEIYKELGIGETQFRLKKNRALDKIRNKFNYSNKIDGTGK